MRLNILFVLLFSAKLLFCQNLPYNPWHQSNEPSSPLDLITFLKGGQINGGYDISSEEIEFEIDFSVNQENNENHKKVKYKSLDSVITILHKKFTGSIAIPILDLSYSYKNGLLHGKWKQESVVLGGQFTSGQFINGKPHGEWSKHYQNDGSKQIEYIYNNGTLIEIRELDFYEDFEGHYLYLGGDGDSVKIYENIDQSTTTYLTDSDTIVESLSNTGYEPIWNRFKSIYELRKNDKLTEKKETKYHVNGKIFSETHIIYGDKTLKTEKYWNESGRLTKEEKYENGVLIKE